MKNKIIILGSTGSIGSTVLNLIKKQNYNVILLSANNNIKKLLQQSIKYNSKFAVIENEYLYKKYFNLFKRNKIKLFYGIKNINKIINNKINFCVNSITGIEGLEPTLKIIPKTKVLLMANKESIICGWHLIHKLLIKNNVEFIPLDSEHFSIWNLIPKSDKSQITKIFITASGGPFLNKEFKNLKNISPDKALKHPNWKMGKKITIDSSTMMNKIFELIEASKIFDLSLNKLSIVIHPESYIHAIVEINNSLIKILAHETTMSVPIANALNINLKKKKTTILNINKLNNLKVLAPNVKNFPLLDLIKYIPNKNSYFETVLVTLNDELVKLFLKKKINYISIHYNLLNMIINPYFFKYYKKAPRNINDIKNMILKVRKFLKLNALNYDNKKYYKKANI